MTNIIFVEFQWWTWTYLCKVTCQNEFSFWQKGCWHWVNSISLLFGIPCNKTILRMITFAKSLFIEIWYAWFVQFSQAAKKWFWPLIKYFLLLLNGTIFFRPLAIAFRFNDLYLFESEYFRMKWICDAHCTFSIWVKNSIVKKSNHKITNDDAWLNV